MAKKARTRCLVCFYEGYEAEGGKPLAVYTYDSPSGVPPIPRKGEKVVLDVGVFWVWDVVSYWLEKPHETGIVVGRNPFPPEDKLEEKGELQEEPEQKSEELEQKSLEETQKQKAFEEAALQVVRDNPDGCFPTEIQEVLVGKGYAPGDVRDMIVQLYDNASVVVGFDRKMRITDSEEMEICGYCGGSLEDCGGGEDCDFYDGSLEE